MARIKYKEIATGLWKYADSVFAHTHANKNILDAITVVPSDDHINDLIDTKLEALGTAEGESY